MLRFDSRPGRCAGAVLAFGVLAIAGCGMPKGDVTGKVAYKGKPLPSGTIAFIGPDDRPLTSVIGADGSYRVGAIPVGTARIVVQTPWDVVEMQKKEAAQLPPDAPNRLMAMPLIEAVEIPKKYSDPEQSGLSYNVQKGSQVHNVDLE